MKKLVIACVSVALAFASEAATCSWSATKIALEPQGGAATSYMAYLIDNSVVARDAMLEALNSGNTSLLTQSAIVESTPTLAQGTTAARFSKSGFGDYTKGAQFEYYTIILNSSTIASATYYMATSAIAASVPETGNLMMTFGDQSTNTWQAMTVPEPTSGLLLLLGMAGLALKRKQA